ncbi:hypothetical protein SCOCK_20058 [Actinacidiphila cocklensis]|uniref:Uncharacterized protein n=1 Tax=Actinacidiphila cocklensis TaxID=887465 RepID=A0A9W4GQ84_9ACTN|nr:hypothetical protein SCOCK_20058 [Actinacidiphila cocklensis]
MPLAGKRSSFPPRRLSAQFPAPQVSAPCGASLTCGRIVACQARAQRKGTPAGAACNAYRARGTLVACSRQTQRTRDCGS